jgi:hypothetical protein
MEPGFVDIARILAFAGKTGLTVVALLLLRVLWREGGPRPLLLAWTALLFEAVALLPPNAYLEALALAARLQPEQAAGFMALRDQSYPPLYLFLSCLGALVPATALAVLARTRAARVAGVGLGAGALLLGVGLAVGGAPADWQFLVNLNRLLSGLRGVAYLAFWIALVLGRLHPVDPFLLVFMAVMTSFSLLLPLQETVFTFFELGAGQVYWGVNQSLQVVHFTILVLVCLILAGKLRRGSPPDLLTVGDQRRTPWKVASLSV